MRLPYRFGAVLLVPAVLFALQVLAIVRTPAAWQPASIDVRLAQGESIELGAQQLAAPQADQRHLRLRRDPQQGWLVQNLSSTHQLLLQRPNAEQRSGSITLQAGQTFQISDQVFTVEASGARQLALRGAGSRWLYDGATLQRDGQRPGACPQTHWSARLLGVWNAAVPQWLAIARPLTLGGNLYCDNRLGLPAIAAGSAFIRKEHDGFQLSAGNPDEEPAALLVPSQVPLQVQRPSTPHPEDQPAQDLRQQELALTGATALIVGHTRFQIAQQGDTLSLRPERHVRLYAAPDLKLPANLSWQWQQRHLWHFSPVPPLLWALAASLLCLLLALPATRIRNASSVMAAVLLGVCGAAALILQRLGQPPDAATSLALAACALLLWLAAPARQTPLNLLAASLLALGLLSQLELGLGAAESSWLRYYQKSAAMLAIGTAGGVLWHLWAQQREALRLHLAQQRTEWLLASFAAVALCGLALQVLLGDETGVFDLQPVELAKLALTALTAHCLALRFNWRLDQLSLAAQGSRWLQLSAPALLFIALLGLALVQVDDFSPLILLLVWSTCMALAYATASGHRALTVALVGAGLVAVASIATLRLMGSDELIRWGFYAERFLVWLHPAQHPHTGQQLLAGAHAIAEGGWWGADQRLGLTSLGHAAGQALRIPAVQDDFAASFFLNRHGLLAGLGLWSLQALFLLALLQAARSSLAMAKQARNFRHAWRGRFRYFALCGGAAFVLGHFLLSWGTNLAIFPIMGQPMSFLSAGGSHLLFFLCPLLAFSAISAPSTEGE